MEPTLLEKAVLAALARGVDSFGGLRKLVNVSEDDLRRAVENLIAKGLVKIEKKGWLLKREALVLTERGFEEARKAIDELAKLAQRIEKSLEQFEQRPQTGTLSRDLVDEIMAIAPLLAWLGFIDLALLSPLGLMVAEAMREDTYIDDEGGESGEAEAGDVDEVDVFEEDYVA